MSLRALIKWWDEFFFRPVSPLPVALFRIAFGTLICIMLVTESMPDWDFWYGPHSPVHMDWVRDYFYHCPVFNFLDIVPASANHGFMWVVLASAVCMTIGLFTRMNCIFVWMMLTSLDHQNPWNISGSDDMMRLMSFCLMFTHCGEMLSVDSWWKRKHHPESVKTAYAPWGQRMLQIQLALSYWGASVAKIGGNQWIDGTAVYYSSHLQDFTRLPVGHLFDSLAMCQFLSWSTLLIETALWLLIWFKEIRYWVLLAGLLLHLGIDYSMTLPIFEMEFIAAYILFVEPEDILRMGKWLRSLAQRLPFKRAQKEPQPVTILGDQAGNSA
jgi:hypothetical protein